MDKYTTLLTNFLDAREYSLKMRNRLFKKEAQESLEYHEKALNAYMEKIERSASKGAARAGLDMLMK